MSCALVLAVLFTVLSAVAVNPYFDPQRFTVTFIASFATLFLLILFWHFAVFRSGRSTRIPATSIPSGAATPRSGVYFKYAGRTRGVFAVTLLIDIAFFLPFLVIVLFVDYFFVLQAFLFSLGVLLAVTLPFVLTLLRKRSLTIDDVGLRCSGRLRSNFDIHWRDITEIDLVEPPTILAINPDPPSPPVYAFVGGDGSILAVFSPQGEFGTGLGDAMERVLLEQAGLHGIRMGRRKLLRGLRRKKAGRILTEMKAK